eukprot:3940902-Rhodomonas_salina.1
MSDASSQVSGSRSWQGHTYTSLHQYRALQTRVVAELYCGRREVAELQSCCYARREIANLQYYARGEETETWYSEIALHTP